MNNTTMDLEPISTEKLLADFSDFTIGELALEITELREALEKEKKLSAAKEFKIQKVAEELEELTTRINTARDALRGDITVPEETE